MANSFTNNVLPLNRPRITGIVPETGTIISVALSDPECVAGSNMPSSERRSHRGEMTIRPSLIQAERVDWASLRCGCGETGAHIPETFTNLLDASTPEEMAKASLEGHAHIQSLLFEVAVPVTSMIMAALVEETSEAIHVRLLDELISCIGGESHWTEVEAGAPELEIDCQIAAREGIWALYQEYATGRASMARMILDEVDADRDRFEYFDAKLIDRVRKRAKRP